MRALALVALVAFTQGAVACGSNIDDPFGSTPSMISPEIVPLGATATVGLLYASGGTWRSSDTAVVTVAADGRVHGRRIGSAYIAYAQPGFRDSVQLGVYASSCFATPPQDTLVGDTVLTIGLDASSCGMPSFAAWSWLPPSASGQPAIANRAGGWRLHLAGPRIVEIEAEASGTRPTIALLDVGGRALEWVHGSDSSARLQPMTLGAGRYRIWVATRGMFDTASVLVVLRTTVVP